MSENPDAAQQQLLRKQFSMVFATVWTDPEMDTEELLMPMVADAMKPIWVQDWIVAETGILPTFPMDDSMTVESEVMTILETLKVNLEEVPALAEAMEDPMRMMDFLLPKIDPRQQYS